MQQLFSQQLMSLNHDMINKIEFLLILHEIIRCFIELNAIYEMEK